jgi:hypothetical protein
VVKGELDAAPRSASASGNVLFTAIARLRKLDRGTKAQKCGRCGGALPV